MAFFLVGCAADQPASALPACAEGLTRDGELCAPRFDVCPEGELAVVGGGCTKIGIPRETGCAPGFPSDGSGSCVAATPSCPIGQVALPGETTCHSVGDCPADRFGDAPAGALFVDASAAAAGDGSRDRPFATIGAALAMAKDGATIAITDGTYTESLDLARAVTLVGRCPSKVTVEGTDPTLPAIQVRAASTLRDLSVRGPRTGIEIDRSIEVALARVWVHDTPREGIRVDTARGSPVVTIRGSLIERIGYAGLRVVGAKVTLDDTVIRDIEADPSRTPGLGCALLAEQNPIDGRRAEVVVHRALFERATDLGVGALGAVLTLDGSLLRETRPNKSGTRGHGLLVQNNPPIAADVKVVGSVIEANSDLGVSVLGPATLALEHSVVRATKPRKKGGLFGTGLQIESGDVTLVDSVIERNRYAGISIKSGTLSLERSIVRDTDAQASDGAFGIGIATSILSVGAPPSKALLRESIVARNHVAGVTAVVTDLLIERSVIVDTAAAVGDGRFGDGVVIHSWFDLDARAVRGRAEIRDSFVARSARAGVSSFAGDLVLARSALRCNLLDFDVEPVEDLPFSIVDAGDSACGCDVSVGCHAQSTGLEPLNKP